MCLADFEKKKKVFQVKCDTSSISIGGLIGPEQHLVAYCSGKMNKAKQRCTTPLSSLTKICHLF